MENFTLTKAERNTPRWILENLKMMNCFKMGFSDYDKLPETDNEIED